MSRLDHKRISLGAIVIVVLTSMMMLANNHMVYGGYDGLLLKAIEQLVSTEVVTVSGPVGISGVMADGSAGDAIELMLFIDGTIVNQSEVELKFYTMVGERISTEEIGRLMMDEDECRFEAGFISEDLTMPLTTLVEEWLVDVDYNEVIAKFLDLAITEQVIIDDPRPGYKQLKRRVTRYGYQGGVAEVVGHIDDQAILTDFQIIIELDEVTVDASMVFQYDVDGG